MKKAIAVVLIACVALGFAFASKSSDIKIGAQLGFGGMNYRFANPNSPSDTYLNANLGGFMFAGTAEYQFSDALSARAELGMNFISFAKSVECVAGYPPHHYEPENNPGAHFIIYLGAQYNLELTKEINLGLGAGFDVLMGLLENTDKDSFNAGMGLAAEAVGSYAINKNISINLGGKFAWHFFNTSDDYKEMVDMGMKVCNLAYQFFAGATYAL